MEGTVRITAPQVVATHYMPRIAARLLDEMRGLQLELVASDSTENLLLREADIAVRMFRPKQGELIARHLGDLATGLYASHDYIGAFGVLTLKTYQSHRLVGYDRNPAMEEWLAARRLPLSRSAMRLRTDDQVAAWRMVLAGVGIGANQRAVGDADPRVRCVLSELETPRLPVWLTVHRELRENRLIRLVYDRLAEELGRLAKRDE